MAYYYNNEQSVKMKKNAWNWKLDGVLEKFFDRSKFGVSVLFDENNNAETLEICTLSNVTQKGETWSHYATIGLSQDDCGGQHWEVYSLFNGKDKNELWVFAYYKRFTDACRCIADGKFKTMKPIKKY